MLDELGQGFDLGAQRVDLALLRLAHTHQRRRVLVDERAGESGGWCSRGGSWHAAIIIDINHSSCHHIAAFKKNRSRLNTIMTRGMRLNLADIDSLQQPFQLLQR